MAQLNDTMVQGSLRVTGKIYGTGNAIRVEDANLAIPPLGVGDSVGSTGDFFMSSGSGKNLPNTVDNFDIHTTVTHYASTTYRLSQIATPTSESNPARIYERGASSSDGVTWTFGNWETMLVSSDLYSIRIPANADLNNYNTDNRIYQCKATNSSSVSNRPSGASGAFELEVIRGTGDTCVQIYYSRDDVSFNYIRKYTGSQKWTAWVKLIDSTDGVTQTYFALANESAFDDVKAAYTAGKRIVGALGGTTSSDNLFRQETPLAFVVFTDNEPTAFTFLFENASPRTASGEGRGSTARWTVSSSGWAISTDNVDYAVTAGTADTAGTLSATLQIAKGGTGATSATAAEYNLLTKTTTKLSAAPAGTDRILFAVGSPSASNGRIGGYRTVDNVADYTLSKVDHYRQNEGISYYQRLCYAKTTGNPGSKGNVHLYDGTNWHNLCNLSSSAGTVRIAGLTSSPATATSNYTKMDIVTGLTLARNGYMGMLYGYVAPKYTTGAQLPTASSDTATSYTKSGKTMAHCSQLKIDGFDTEAVGSGHAVFTGSSILHIALLSGTLTFAIEGDFSVFTSGAQYFFSIPVSFGNLKA